MVDYKTMHNESKQSLLARFDHKEGKGTFKVKILDFESDSKKRTVKEAMMMMMTGSNYRPSIYIYCQSLLKKRYRQI